jgi:Flp pilus assembly protein TadD
MAKKSKRSIHHQKGLALPRLLEQQVSRAQQQMLQGDFPGTISTCEPLLTSLPRRSSLRAEVLILLGLAHGMLHHYEESYDLFTEALTIDPTNAEVWYNRGLACRFTTRLGQAVRDFERAVTLSRNDTSELTRKFVTELKISRKDLQEAMREHGTSITLEQYIEREERFMLATSLMRQSKWQEAELAFRQVIEMGGGLPQYWGNLGISLIMQTRYEEAEAALRRALEIDPYYTLARTNLEKIPDVQRAGGPLSIELRDLSQVQGIKQSIAFSKQGHSASSPATHTTIEKAGNALKRTGKPLGKQPPLYRFFLNPYQDARFPTCPQCGLKTRQRKCPLVIHVNSMPALILGKTCRYCVNCDLLIAHQDQVEEQLALYFASSHLEITSNDYLVIGTLDRPEWRKGMQDPLSIQEMVEHLHDFKEVVAFQRAYV